MKIYDDITQLIGNTPIVKIKNTQKKENLKANIYLKLEYFNPGGSVKDRVALNMILEAEKSGLLKKDGIIVEPTSGNTGIGLAAVASSLGYRLIIVMPGSMSEERKKIIQLYGAELVLSEPVKGMSGAIEMATDICNKTHKAIILGQFTNEANPAAHKKTAEEIWESMDGQVDVVVAGVGTGGTITGIGQTLKSKKADIKIIAVEPSTSAVLSGKEKGNHKLQGLGAGFIPKILDTEVYDEVMPIEYDEAIHAVRETAENEGLLLGISSGAAIAAAKKLADMPEYEGKNILAICPDTGERYLSVL